jgi:hypothetical protein
MSFWDPSKLLAGLWGGFSVRDADFNLPQHRHDLLWFVPLHGHDPLFLQVDSLSFHLVQKWPVTSKTFICLRPLLRMTRRIVAEPNQNSPQLSRSRLLGSSADRYSETPITPSIFNLRLGREISVAMPTCRYQSGQGTISWVLVTGGTACR